MTIVTGSGLVIDVTRSCGMVEAQEGHGVPHGGPERSGLPCTASFEQGGAQFMDGHAGRQVVVDLGESYVRVRILTGGEVIEPAWADDSSDAGTFGGGVVLGEHGRLHCGVRPLDSKFPEAVTGFLSRVDDDVPVIVGRESVPAATLVAAQLTEVVDRVEAEFGRVALLTVVHPDSMTPGGRLRVACRLPASFDVRWRSRAELVASRDTVSEPGHSRIAVVHLGQATVEASIWSPGVAPRRVGDVVVTRACGGTASDDAILDAVATSDVDAGRGPSTTRQACSAARRRLDGATAADVLRGDEADPARATSTFRLVRSELQELTRDVLDQQLSVLRSAIARSGITADAIGSVVLTGSGSTAPGAVEAFSEMIGGPVRVVPRASALVVEDPGYVERAPAVATAGAATEPVTGVTHDDDGADPLSLPASRSTARHRVPILAAAATAAVVAMAATATALPNNSVVEMLAGTVGIELGEAGTSASAKLTGGAGKDENAQKEWVKRLRTAVTATTGIVVPNAEQLIPGSDRTTPAPAPSPSASTDADDKPGKSEGKGADAEADKGKDKDGKSEKDKSTEPTPKPSATKPTSKPTSKPTAKPSKTSKPTTRPSSTPKPTTPAPEPSTTTPDPTPTPEPTPTEGQTSPEVEGSDSPGGT